MRASAAIYVRSSKDRSDVSISAQRRELQKLALDRGLAIVREYQDVVESAKDERRPGFQAMLADLKASGRPWDYLLLVDTSRLSRRQYMAQVFNYEAKKRGVQILYSKLPPADPIADLVVVGVMQVFDELHSLMSKEKGLAGMAENVRRGWRAGGRAPRGYRLKPVHTGAIRDRKPVAKSVLEPGPEADTVRRYLEARAAGRPRAEIVGELGVSWAKSSLIEMERNALTYAGHTVWNVHNERVEGRYVGGTKRRPREDWVIQRDTHTALISEADAEALLASLEKRSHGRRRGKGAYLLSGVLETPKGARWHGEGRGRYRCHYGSHAKTIAAAIIDQAVVRHVVRDLQSDRFVKAMAESARQGAESGGGDPVGALKSRRREVEKRIHRYLELAGGLRDPAPALREIDGMEAERAELTSQIGAAEREAESRKALANVTEETIRDLLDELAGNLEAAPQEQLRTALESIIERVVLDPETRSCEIHYRVGLRDKVASPKRPDLVPYFRAISDTYI